MILLYNSFFYVTDVSIDCRVHGQLWEIFVRESKH